MNRFIQFLLLCTTIAWSINLFGQGRTCGSDALMQELMQDAKYKQAWEQRQAQFKQMNQVTNKVPCPNPVILPMAVHFQGISNPDQACLIALAQDQIRILNEDYQGTNADISNWINNDASYYPGLNYGETCIQFCLATNNHCLLYTSPSPRDLSTSRMPSSA